MKKALLSFNRTFFDPTSEKQRFYAASASIIGKSLYDSLQRAGYEVEYIDATESPKDPGSYDIFIGTSQRWTEIAESCDGAKKVLFMPTSHPSNRNEVMRRACKQWYVPHDEELLDERSSDLRVLELADYIIQIGNEVNVDALLKNGVPREKIIQIHYGLPSSWATDVPRAHGTLDTYIETASEHGLRKGLPELVKAFGAPPFNDKHLTLVGEIRKNENHAYWLSQIANLKRHNSHIAQIGFIDATSKKYTDILANNAWYLFPSIEEGEPGTVLEAMTLGLVPILTRASGVDFALDDDFNASFQESLAKTLDISTDGWQTLSTKAQRYVEMFHDHTLWEKRLTELFRMLHAGERDLSPTASIILTVHDKEKHIVRLLETLLAQTRSYPKWDLHIVYDGCSDASREVAQHVLKDFPVPVYEYETPDVWEIKANNYGLKRAQGKYCIILQDDNFVYEPAWLEKMLSWLEEHPKVGILGGLAGVNFFHLDSDPQGEGVNRSLFELHQRLDPVVNKKLNEYVYEADAVMRGPIILRKELLEKHGYFDEAYAPLYNDDMDYCFRMRSLGYGVFCYPINAVNESLTVAQYKDPEKDIFWRTTAEKNQKLFYERWKDDIEKHHPYHLKVPKPTYAQTPSQTRRESMTRIMRHVRHMATFDIRGKVRIIARSIFLNIPVPVVRGIISVLRKLGARPRSLADKLYIHRFEAKTIPWRLARGDTTLRLDYPLDASSVVYNIGKQDTLWAEAVHARYGCHVRSAETFAPTDHAEHIDLMSLNMRGKEYVLLEQLIKSSFIKNIKNIQVKFDDAVPQAREQMRTIRRKLRETHMPTYQYEFVWENWERKG